jgi:hypothetical protein
MTSQQSSVSGLILRFYQTIAYGSAINRQTEDKIKRNFLVSPVFAGSRLFYQDDVFYERFRKRDSLRGIFVHDSFRKRPAGDPRDFFWSGYPDSLPVPVFLLLSRPGDHLAFAIHAPAMAGTTIDRPLAYRGTYCSHTRLPVERIDAACRVTALGRNTLPVVCAAGLIIRGTPRKRERVIPRRILVSDNRFPISFGSLGGSRCRHRSGGWCRSYFTR